MFGNLFEKLATPLLQQYLGETIQQYPQGNPDLARNVRLINAPRERARNTDRGVLQLRRREIDVPSALVIHPRDQWLIAGQLWNTNPDGIGEPADGLRTIAIERPQPNSTSHPDRNYDRR